MAANKIICPLEHDSGVLWGGLPTLGYRLFQLLADNPLGLHLGQIERALSRQNAPGDNAEQVLIESKYFCQTGTHWGPAQQLLARTAMHVGRIRCRGAAMKWHHNGELPEASTQAPAWQT